MSTQTRPVALTIAGSDSGGGAGIQADLKTFHQFGVYATTVVTAVTAQNTVEVSAVHAVPPDVVRAQLDAVMADLRPAAVKSGMLGAADTVATVAEGLDEHGVKLLVVDPVMASSSGRAFLDAEALSALQRLLLPLATLVTPNLPEASVLSGIEVDSVERMAEAARILVDRGARAALVKGGHLRASGAAEGERVDVLWNGASLRAFHHPGHRTRHTHGTGCTLAAAITAGLALGRALPEAIEDAIRYVDRAIATAPGLGRGRGPLNHFAPLRTPREAPR